jgi:hypothetical protein
MEKKSWGLEEGLLDEVSGLWYRVGVDFGHPWPGEMMRWVVKRRNEEGNYIPWQ